MDKDKVLKQLQLDIKFSKTQIDELTKDGRNTDKVFYQGMLQAYEYIQSRITNGYWD